MTESLIVPHLLIVKDEYFKGGSVAVSDNSLIIVSNDTSSVYVSWFGEEMGGTCRLISEKTAENIWKGFDKLNLWLNHSEERALRYGDCSGQWYFDLFNDKSIILRNVKKSTCTCTTEDGRNPIGVYFKIPTQNTIDPCDERVIYINNILENASTFNNYQQITLSILNTSRITNFFTHLFDPNNKDSVVDIQFQKPNVLKIENSHITITLEGTSDQIITDDVKTTINITKINEFIQNTNSKTIQFIIMGNDMPLIIKTLDKQLFLLAPVETYNGATVTVINAGCVEESETNGLGVGVGETEIIGDDLGVGVGETEIIGDDLGVGVGETEIIGDDLEESDTSGLGVDIEFFTGSGVISNVRGVDVTVGSTEG